MGKKGFLNSKLQFKRKRSVFASLDLYGFFLILLGVLLLSMAGFAAFRGSGAILHHRVDSLHDQWRESGSVGDLSSITSAAPVYLSPFGRKLGDANLAFAIGDLQALSSVTDGSINLVAGEKALAYLRQSLRLRPAWGRAWARLALVKASLGQVDSEMEQSLRNALRFSPHESGVRSMVVHAAVMGLRGFSQSAKQEFWPIVEGVIKSGKHREVLRWAADAGLTGYLTQYLGPDVVDKLRKRGELHPFRASPYSGARP